MTRQRHKPRRPERPQFRDAVSYSRAPMMLSSGGAQDGADNGLPRFRTIRSASEEEYSVMTSIDHAHRGQDRLSDQHIDAEQSLLSALRERRPLVLFLGQDAWGSPSRPDPILVMALDRLGRPQDAEKGWPALLTSRPLPDNYFEWLAERFSRRPQAIWLETLARLPWSAIFTSSIDSEINSVLRSHSREPQVILTANEIPVASRSTSRTPIYYLYGRAGLDDQQATPPKNSSQLRQRTVLQAIPMLNRLPVSATPIGLVIIDG
jgi:hypothetical protein